MAASTSVQASIILNEQKCADDADTHLRAATTPLRGDAILEMSRAPGSLDQAAGLHHPLVGRHSRYRVLGKLGAGGMGTLYLAEQAGPAGFRRVVVLKFIHTEDSAEEGFRDRLRDEAHLTAQIDHPNVGKVLGFEEVEDQIFIVLERVEGVNLEVLCQRWGAALPPWIAAGLMAQACAGLQAAHDQTISGRPLHLIHRDVSRTNLMVDTGGRVRVVDFGIARADVRRSRTLNVVLGNVAYMAPEQLAGQAIDHRADTYAAALVFYQLCLGRHPFDNKLTRTSLPWLWTHEIAVTTAVDEAIEACLDLDPAGRPDRIEALGEVLRRYAAERACASPGELAAWFREHGVLLAPEPTTLIPRDETATHEVPRRPPAAPAGLQRIRLPAGGGQALRLADGRQLVLYTTRFAGRRAEVIELALSRVPGLLPAPLSVTCAGEALSLQCEAAAELGDRVALYIDAEKPETRQERVLVTPGQGLQRLDFGNRRRGPLVRLGCAVGERSRSETTAVLADLPVRVAAPPDVKLLFAVSVVDPQADVVHTECVCVTSNPEL